MNRAKRRQLNPSTVAEREIEKEEKRNVEASSQAGN